MDLGSATSESTASLAVHYFLQMHYRKYGQKKLGAYLQQSCPPPMILDNIQFKKVKAKALMALKKWIAGSWRFHLTDRILTPYQVLAFQSQGIRPVSKIEQPVFAPVLHKEDALEFFLHDLEHGYMFFHDDQLYKKQQLFFQKIELSIQQCRWDSFLHDPIFKKKFYYLIADMNTHIDHYRSYLNAILPRGQEILFADLFVFDPKELT